MTKRASPVIHRNTALDCIACGERLGGDILPVSCTEDDGHGKGRVERWCPQDFVGIRAERDSRWRAAVHMGQIIAITCGACHKTTVDFGRRICPQCGSKNILHLLPKGTVLKASALKEFAAAHGMRLP